MKSEIAEKFKPFRLSPLTRAIEELMLESNEGDVISYADLSSLIGMDCAPSGKGYSYVISAIKRLERSGCNFANIKTVGYKRLNPDETINDNTRRIQISQRQMKRTLVRNEAVEHDRLSDLKKIEHTALTIVSRLTGRLLSTRNRTKMIEVVKAQPDPQKVDYEKMSEIYLRGKA